MGQIKHYNNGKWTIYTSGEGLSGYTGVTDTYYIGADLNNDGNLSKANPDGSLVNLEKPNVGFTGFTYEIGEYIPSQGGVIFYRYLDGATQHYLVVGINDASISAIWDGTFSPPALGCVSFWDGATNFVTLNAATNTEFTSAAYSINTWGPTTTSLFDWYLPAVDELSLLWQNRFNVNRTLSGYSSYGSIVSAVQVGYEAYWSSTEYGNNDAWFFVFTNGVANYAGKDLAFYVRAIRKFSI